MDSVLNRKRACDRCHKLKRQCDGGEICKNCKNLSLDCSYNRPTRKMGRKKVNRPSSQLKYSHNGCGNCKQRRKKCSEDWPTCFDCQRLGLVCDGPRDKGDQSFSNMDRPQSMEVVEESGEGTEQQQEQHQSQHQHHHIHQHQPNGEINIFYDNLKSPLNILEITNDLFYGQDELTNKERLLLNSLIKSPTFELDLLKVATPNIVLDESISPNSIASDPELYEEEKNSLLSMCSMSSLTIRAKELELLRYFITNVSPLLFVDKASTRFLRTVIPLAIEDQLVRMPIIAISASHRANNSIAVNLEYQRDATVYRAKSQALFIGNHVDYMADDENILLSILLISIQEIFEGTSLYWNVAMEKAASLIEKRGGIKKVSKFAPLSTQLFCYLDLISSLSTCSSPYVDKSQVSDYDEQDIETILNSKFGFRFGIAGEIFKIIGNISTLASLRTNRYDSKENEQRFNNLANLIEMRLQKWSPKLDLVANTFQIDNSMDDGKLILSSYTVALQWSAFLRLHQIRYGYNRKDSRIEACLAIILKSMKVIRFNTDVETGLMFPLIMAGSVAYKTEDREYILSRIRSIKNRLKFSYLGEFEKMIISVWDRDNDENHQVNWAKIRYYQFLGLVMF